MSYQPDTTQRSIIEEARKSLPALQQSFPDREYLDVAVLKPMEFFVSPEQAALALEWDKGGGYVVTFRRTPGGDWAAVSIR